LRAPKRGSLADRMLGMLEKAFPEGVPTSEIARELYNNCGLNERVKVARLARNLRRLGYRVYGIGGVYHLGTPAILETVNRRLRNMTCGLLAATAETARGIEEVGDAARADELRQELKRAVSEALKAV